MTHASWCLALISGPCGCKEDPRDKIEGALEVGTTEKGEVIINHPDLKPDENGVGHIVFSVNQARHLAMLLLKKAEEAQGG